MRMRALWHVLVGPPVRARDVSREQITPVGGLSALSLDARRPAHRGLRRQTAPPLKDRAVILTGAVSTYAQKFAAVRAASRVYGVKAVADGLIVKPTGEPRDDSDITRATAHILDNNTQIPEGKVHAQVRAGWVTLNGEVEWQYQRRCWDGHC